MNTVQGGVITEQKSSGDHGETIAGNELERRGWAISWPPANQPNYDLLAERQGLIRRVQIKTSTEKKSLDWIAGGRCSSDVLYNDAPILNRVSGADPCDSVICVTYLKDDPATYRVFVFPAGDAEHYFRKHALAYYLQPGRHGQTRKPGPVFLKVGGKAYANVPDDREALAAYENAWHHIEA